MKVVKNLKVEPYSGEDKIDDDEDDYIELKEEGIIVSDEPTDNIEELEEDIPFQDDWERISLVGMKQSISNWIDDNLENEDVENYDIHSKEDETRLYVKVHQENSEDEEDDTDHYFCIFEKHETKKVEMTDVKF
tara:strand:+ start:53 stop:454 length:402 start_codon:yes stop_codon:yes gene_type:complete